MMASKPPSQLNSQLVLLLTRYLSRAHTVVYRIRGRLGRNLRVGAGFRKPAPTLLLEHRGGPDVVIVASAGGQPQ
jgi:hypothetical protein